MTATELVDSFATGFLHTTVHRLPGSGYSWRRGPGPDHPTTLAAPANSVQSTIGTPAIASVKISWPTPAGTELHYAVPGAATLARLLWADLPHHLLQRLETIVHNTGELLSHLHHLPRQASLADTPPNGPLRLAHWLDTGQGPRDAPRLHHALRETLGDTRWAELRAWCTTLTTTGHPDPVLLHGAPSTGTLVLSPTLSESALLTGEDLATGPAFLRCGLVPGRVPGTPHDGGTPQRTPAVAAHTGRFLPQGIRPRPGHEGRGARCRPADRHTRPRFRLLRRLA